MTRYMILGLVLVALGLIFDDAGLVVVGVTLVIVEEVHRAAAQVLDAIEQPAADVRAAAVAPVLALCDECDALSKGESPTTAKIRAAAREAT